MSAAHTPGPWEWFERMPGRPYLATPDRGQLYVMGFNRKGMQGAAPCFSHWPGIQDGAPRERKGGIMEDGLLLRDGNLHPDARLIAAAPELLAALERANTLLAELTFSDWIPKKDAPSTDIRQRINAAHVIASSSIAKATGVQQ